MTTFLKAGAVLIIIAGGLALLAAVVAFLATVSTTEPLTPIFSVAGAGLALFLIVGPAAWLFAAIAEKILGQGQEQLEKRVVRPAAEQGVVIP
jgi:hypothetical protein